MCFYVRVCKCGVGRDEEVAREVGGAGEDGKPLGLEVQLMLASESTRCMRVQPPF